jgi:Tfp pilus assembly protein PilF
VRVDSSWTLDCAALALRHGNATGAVEDIRGVLGEDPENARAHALLAFALLSLRRRHAARHEAELAIACDPEQAFPHRIRGYVALAENDAARANAAFEQAVSLNPDDEQNLLGLARCHLAARRFGPATQMLARVLEADASSSDAYEVQARLELERGDLPAAEEAAQRALAIDPESAEALTLLGTVRLRGGNAEAARDLALWALQLDPSDDGALRLMADIKARQSWHLGLWWRLMTWLSRLGIERAMLVMTLMFVVQHAGVLLLNDLGYEQAALGLSILWLIFCAYTWGAGSIQQRMVAKELESVRLKPGF